MQTKVHGSCQMKCTMTKMLSSATFYGLILLCEKLEYILSNHLTYSSDWNTSASTKSDSVHPTLLYKHLPRAKVKQGGCCCYPDFTDRETAIR